MKTLSTISKLFGEVHTDQAKIPPTILYNEGWMLRLTLEWYLSNPQIYNHDLSMPGGNRWYSEALLSSPFLHGAGYRESQTHADGVVGKFDIGLDAKKKGELTLKEDCRFLYVVEAKMGSQLSSKVENAIGYNQAARTVACIADLLVQQNIQDKEFTKLAFYVLMPGKNKHFSETTNLLLPSSIEETTKTRLDSFPKKHDRKSTKWLRDNLHSFVNERIEIKLLDWDKVIKEINDPDLQHFYDQCKKYNGIK